jgi:hypothetical protein
MVIQLFFTLICFPRPRLARYSPDSRLYYALAGIAVTPSLRLVSQSAARQIQIGQGTEHKQGIGILVQPTVVDLGKIRHAFDHRKDMLHPGPDFRLGAVARLGRFIQRLIAMSVLMGEVLCTGSRSADNLALASIDRVAPYPRFFPVQLVFQYLRVMYITCCRHHRAKLFALADHPDMDLHAEVPLPFFARGAHLRIARLVLGRTRCANNAGVRNGAAGNAQAPFLQVLAHRLKQRLPQGMLLQQMPEVENGRLVWHSLPSQVDADKAAHRAGLIEGFLRTRIRQVEPVLVKVDAQHPLQTDRRTTISRFGIVWLNALTQLIPRYQPVHLGQKLSPAGRLAVALKVPSSKDLLSHQYLSVVNVARIIADVST